jgi:hypothetical protein
MFNELSDVTDADGNKVSVSKKAYILRRPQRSQTYMLHDTRDTPFLHHVIALNELKKASDSGNIYLHHFNMLRGVLEKTAAFFGRKHISTCFNGLPRKKYYSRTLQVKSHAAYSVFDPVLLDEDEKKKFREILNAFFDKYDFLILPTRKRKQRP